MTTFHVIGELPSDASGAWGSVMQRQPDQVSGRPAENLHMAEGSYNGIERQLQCSVRPDRTDWVLRSAPMELGVHQTGLVTVGLLDTMLPTFQETCNRWLDICPGVTRLAFGAVLMAESPTLQDAYRQLDSMLPSVTLDPPRISDFFYQINRRRDLDSVRGVLANRISKWSAAQVGSIEFSIGGANTPPRVVPAFNHFACRLELDINTASTFPDSLRSLEAVKLFGELTKLGREIAEKGDVW